MRARKMGFTLVLCLIVVASCGVAPAAKPQLIDTPAKDMNLVLEDLEAGYTLMSEQGLDALQGEWNLPDKSLKDANLRTFDSDNGMAMAALVTLDEQATASDLKDLSSGLEKGFSGELPGVELKELDAPAIGDEAVLTAATLEEYSMSVYLLAFRKANVVSIVALVGLGDAAGESVVVSMGKKIEARIK